MTQIKTHFIYEQLCDEGVVHVLQGSNDFFPDVIIALPKRSLPPV